MTHQPDTCTTRRSRRNGGFTLIELVSVMILVAILAASAVPAMNSLGQTRAAGAAVDLHRSTLMARQYAVSTGVRTWMVFDIPGNAWSVLIEDPAAPGRAGATAMIDPSTGAPFIAQLDLRETSGVNLISANFDGASEIGFDWLGRPLNALEADLTTTGTVVLTNGHQIVVEVETGHVTHVFP